MIKENTMEIQTFMKNGTYIYCKNDRVFPSEQQNKVFLRTIKFLNACMFPRY